MESGDIFKELVELYNERMDADVGTIDLPPSIENVTSTQELVDFITSGIIRAVGRFSKMQTEAILESVATVIANRLPPADSTPESE